MYYRDVEFESLIGQTITNIIGGVVDAERLVLKCESGRIFVMYHEQDCCEIVSLNSIDGDINALIGNQIVMADESSSGSKEEECGSCTWTFYKLCDNKGHYVTLRWYGESNGYYSEEMSFAELSSSPLSGEHTFYVDDNRDEIGRRPYTELRRIRLQLMEISKEAEQL